MSAQMDAALKNLHTSIPGIIISFDPDNQSASVQPAIRRIFTEAGAVNLPPCVDVPVQFPSGGNFVLTFPVTTGDECILLFSERAIDFWWVNGGVQLPAEYRLHDLSDAMAIVGLRSNPRKLADFQTTGAELRTISRSTFIRLEEGSIHIKGNIIHEGNLDRTGTSTTSGLITGGGGMAVSGGSGVSINGDLTNNGKNISSTHTHTGVVPGGGVSGPVS